MTTSTFHRSSNSAAPVAVAWTRRDDGDFHPNRVATLDLVARQRSIVDLPWTMLDQCHGASVVRVSRPGDRTGERADAAVTDSTGAALAVWAADCAPIVLVGAEHEFAVVHAGWRGLRDGVIEAAVAAFREPVELGVVGPVICGSCYEFGRDDLASVASSLGVDPSAIRSTTHTGSHGLDMGVAVAAALSAHNLAIASIGECPGCSPDPGFSHRVRGDRERHVMVAWQASR